jgi:hypothetical protein
MNNDGMSGNNQPQQPQYNQAPGAYPQGYPLFPQQQQPPKKKRWPLIIGIIVGALVLCGLCGGIGSMMSHGGTSTTTTTDTTTSATTTNSNTSSSSTTTKAAPTSAPAKPLTWQTTHKFNGNGEKKTDVFTVGDTWKIKYTCNGMGQGIDGNLAVSVYSSNGTIQDLAVNATCKDGQTTTDTTTEHQGGQIYLDVNATSDWTIEVLEQK